jgi:hypothetical protein
MDETPVDFVSEGEIRAQVLAVLGELRQVIEELLPGAAVEHVDRGPGRAHQG